MSCNSSPDLLRVQREQSPKEGSRDANRDIFGMLFKNRLRFHAIKRSDCRDGRERCDLWLSSFATTHTMLSLRWSCRCNRQANLGQHARQLAILAWQVVLAKSCSCSDFELKHRASKSVRNNRLSVCVLQQDLFWPPKERSQVSPKPVHVSRVLVRPILKPADDQSWQSSPRSLPLPFAAEYRNSKRSSPTGTISNMRAPLR